MAKKRKVPEKMKRTPRKKAVSTYVFPKRKSYPIGDLYHARMAVLRVMWPNNVKNASAVLKAVKKRWPKYDWASYFNKERRESKKERKYVKTYSYYMKRK